MPNDSNMEKNKTEDCIVGSVPRNIGCVKCTGFASTIYCVALSCYNTEVLQIQLFYLLIYVVKYRLDIHHLVKI